MCRFLYVALIILSSNFSFSQTNKIDSLKRELINATDTSRVNILNCLALELKRDTDSALVLLNQALELSENINFTKGKATTYNSISNVYTAWGDYDNALGASYKSLVIRQKNGDKRGITSTLNSIGNIYIKQGSYEKALANHLRALELMEAMGERESLPLNNIAASYYFLADYENAHKYYTRALEAAEALGNKKAMFNPSNGIGNVYFNMGEYEKALFYYKKALSISSELKNKLGVSQSLTNIGNVYMSLKNNDTALTYHQKALSIKEELGAKASIITSLMNVGSAYNEKGDYGKALEYYERALYVSKDGESKNAIAKLLMNIGILYGKQGSNFDKSVQYLKRGVMLSDSINSKDLVMMGNEALSEVYFKKGDYKSAYDYYKEYISTKDSVLNETNTKNIAEINTKYETEKKEKEIESLTKDKLIKDAQLESQRNQRNGFIIGIALLVLLIILAYNRYRIKQKASKEIAEKNKEITESISYAKRIQSSFLTSEKYISQRLPDYFIYYNPRNIVSGDFYWLMEKNNHMYVCTADCTGHGIPGAFMSLISMGILNEIIYSKTHLTHTDDILNELRRIIIMAVNPEGSSEEGKDGMDAVLCRFDFQKMELEYSAANNSFFIIRNGELLVFKPDKMPVGKYIGVEKPFTRNTVSIEKGDCIYTFSDGYADQFGGPEDKKFQSKRLKELFLNNCHKPMAVQQEVYERTLKEWQGANEQIDDILVMGIRV